MKKSTSVAVAVIAVSLLLGIARSKAGPAESPGTIQSEDTRIHALQMSQLIATYEVNKLHASLTQQDRHAAVLLEQMSDRLEQQLDVTWKTKYWSANMHGPNPLPNALSSDVQSPRPSTFELHAISKLAQSTDRESGVLSRDKRQFIRLFRNTESCAACHIDHEVGAPIGFISVELNRLN